MSHDIDNIGGHHMSHETDETDNDSVRTHLIHALNIEDGLPYDTPEDERDELLAKREKEKDD